MPQQSLVSVVIATNRDSPFLAEAIASVVAQSYPEWELIVVDNGVPEPASVHRLVDAVPRGRVLEVPPPVTVSLARNVGASQARGEYLVFLDDDDTWHPERLARQVSALSSVVSAPASYCGGWHMDAAGAAFPPSWPATPASADDMLSGRGRMPHICGAMMIRRASFAEVGGFSPELTMMEDFELALRLAQRGGLVCVPDELVGYRRHGGNATSTALPNARVRRDAIDGVLSRHAWAARARGDDETAALLDEHRALERSRAAQEAASATLWALRRMRGADVLREVRWGVSHDPRAFVGAVVRRLVRRR